MSVLGYIRVSSEEQAREGVSMAEQRDAIARYCAEEGLGNPNILEEPGVSGFSKPLRRRPKGLLLWEAAHGRSCSAIIVTRLDRLSRVTSDIVALGELARDRGFHLHIVRDPTLGRVNTATTIGEFFLTMAAALARLESGRTGERVREGLEFKRAQAGGVPINGQAPYGWRWIKGEGRHVPVPEEQAVLRTIHTLRAAGLSGAAIAENLNRQGVRPRRGSCWHGATVRGILEREGSPHHQ